ncbi:FdtA/QdtA family cupin domain-containing protein [Myroides sp. NP-2]|uniref:sugar 3,4-ketoisomerase n=1 Tax=Myroides sp. NP-2 TaxID=2759945 RepID=UPI0015F7A5F2|nr:FdtA/QdtA family cupin domain-containing protein [Myroides sp. NP-2]MBB1149516.1 FdtA/QdtA family cupin domain-containing protein [Myroides sp. NP-2]
MKKYSIFDCREIVVPQLMDERGTLAVIEENILPFEIKRLFFIYGVPRDKHRGGHAHKEQTTVLFAINGSFEVMLDDGNQKRKVYLEDPTKGLILQPGIWSVLDNFEAGTVCLAVNSGAYDESDYIRSYDLFLASRALLQEV